MNQLPISLARNWDATKNRSVNQLVQQMVQPLDFDMSVDVIEWVDLWDKLKSLAQHKSDIVISEIGSTWLADFVEQDVLYSFTEEDIEQIGDFHNFSGWQFGTNSTWRGVYAIPWLSDSQVLYYWQDMIEDAGVDPTIEFASVNSFEHSLSKISQKILRYPWAVSTVKNPASLHQLASWIWGSNTDIISEDGRQIHLLDIKAIQAVTHYFNLYRYIPEFSRTSPAQMTAFFANREAALMMGGTRMYYELKRRLPEHLMSRIGVTLPPGVPFVGTQHLVMWNHADVEQKKQGIAFLKAFLSPDVHHKMSKIIGLMPTQTNIQNDEAYQQDEFLWTINTAIQIGRSYPPLPQWTTVEHHLMDTMARIWDDIFINQATDVENVVFKHMIRFGQNIRPILG